MLAGHLQRTCFSLYVEARVGAADQLLHTIIRGKNSAHRLIVCSVNYYCNLTWEYIPLVVYSVYILNRTFELLQVFLQTHTAMNNDTRQEKLMQKSILKCI